MPFTPINTQEEFDAAIKDRLAQQARKYEKYISPDDLETTKKEYQEKIDDLENQVKDANRQIKDKDSAIAERDTKIKGYETDSVKKRIARDAGLPDDAADYLKGDDAEALKKSAESLRTIIGAKSAAPLKNTEGNVSGDAKDAAYKNMLAGLKGEEE